MQQEIDFVAPCPVLGCVNALPDKCFQWIHSSCRGYMKVTKAGYLRCTNCECTGEILDWLFNCLEHDYKPISSQGTIFAFGVLCQIKGLSDDWFTEVTDRVKEQERKRMTVYASR